jgi:hypothetical protein
MRPGCGGVVRESKRRRRAREHTVIRTDPLDLDTANQSLGATAVSIVFVVIVVPHSTA